MRSAEKKRSSSCAFADRVALLSIDFYELHCPADIKREMKQTVIASFVVQYPADTDGVRKETDDDVMHVQMPRLKSRLQVASLGVGTKVLPAHLVELHDEKGERVRDLHAEVLARRGFNRFLYDQIELFLAMQESDTSDCRGELGSRCIFSRAEGSDLLVLRQGITVHMYTSSAPCGNATIKRWAKPAVLPFREDLTADEFDVNYSHPRLHFSARHEGQTALLVKMNNHGSSRTVDCNACPCPGTRAAIFTAPGTAATDTGLGNVMTCSDKIAGWCALGVQGALLSGMLAPVYLSSITIGRKFSLPHCCRALCCRLQDFHFRSSVEDSVQEWRTHHPVLLGTQIKLDNGAIETAPDSEGNDSLVGAQFLEKRGLCCYVYNMGCQLGKGKDSTTACEVLDGSTGLRLSRSYGECFDTEVQASSISTSSFFDLYKSLFPKYLSRICTSNNNNVLAVPPWTRMNAGECSLNATLGADAMGTLNYRQYKRMGRCLHYSRAKDMLRRDPLLLGGWIRKRATQQIPSTSGFAQPVGTSVIDL